jgi:NAD dependent epimerase/dehydratase family enzyme
MKTLAMVKGKRFFHPPLPAVLLKLFFGEMSQMILTGSRISPEKIIQAGYSFLFDNPHNALNDLQN